MIGEWTKPPGAEMLVYAEVGGKHVPAGSKNGYAVRYKDERGIWRVKITRDAKGNESAHVTVSDRNSTKLEKRAVEIQAAVLEAARGTGFYIPSRTVPLAVICTFYTPHPKTHYGTGANADKLKDSAPAFPISPPDCTKIWRGFEDALTGYMWHDDSRVVGQFISEEFVERWDPLLTRFSLYALPATVAEHRAIEGDPAQDSLLAAT
jgi:Holliday junction resolvase RusA-like endonuclease